MSTTCNLGYNSSIMWVKSQRKFSLQKVIDTFGGFAIIKLMGYS